MIFDFRFQILITGVVKDVPEGKTAPGGIELTADYWELVGDSPAGGMDNVLNEESHIDVLLDNRHLALRGETLSKIMRARSVSFPVVHLGDDEDTEFLPATIIGNDGFLRAITSIGK